MRRIASALSLLVTATLAVTSPVSASSPIAWSEAVSAARNACVKASGLDDAAASAPVHFSDRIAQDVILVTGHFPQKAVKGKPGTMLCLYDRRTKRAETQEATAWSRPSR